jgi:hypothetical protein
MATYNNCEICCEDKFVVPCCAGSVCDKKVCMQCRSKIDNFNCAFCFGHETRMRVIDEIQDRFNWAWGQGPRGIDDYVKRYNVWSYGCLEIPECECDYCSGDPDEEFWNQVFANEMSNP